MEKIYVLWNFDCNEPIMTSHDRGLLEEVMWDMFADDVQMLYHFDSNPNYTLDWAWEDNLDYYQDYIEILELNVVD